jgi:hypothetical protein
MMHFLRTLACMLALATAGCTLFGVSEQEQVARDAVSIQKCQKIGREAGSYKSYSDCMVDAGLHEGGSK